MTTEKKLPNLVTIVGRGVPSNYELTVDGTIELMDADPLEELTIVSDQAAEGCVETGVLRFRFSGELANVHLVDWNGVSAPDSSNIPRVHVEYGVCARNGSGVSPWNDGNN